MSVPLQTYASLTKIYIYIKHHLPQAWDRKWVVCTSGQWRVPGWSQGWTAGDWGCLPGCWCTCTRDTAGLGTDTGMDNLIHLRWVWIRAIASERTPRKLDRREQFSCNSMSDRWLQLSFMLHLRCSICIDQNCFSFKLYVLFNHN